MRWLFVSGGSWPTGNGNEASPGGSSKGWVDSPTTWILFLTKFRASSAKVHSSSVQPASSG